MKKTKNNSRYAVLSLASLASLALLMGCSTSVFADNSGEEICTSVGSSSTECESGTAEIQITARGKYWLTLSEYFDNDGAGAIHKAGIMGGIAATGGDFNPVAWECSNIDSSGNFVTPWNTLYNQSSGSGMVGVGSFAITYNLSTYLHYVNDNAADLIKYFKNPKDYSFSICRHETNYNHDDDAHTYGDELLEKIGGTDFGRLVSTEVAYVVDEFVPETIASYKNTTFPTPGAAADWWIRNFVNPVNPDTVSTEASEKALKAYDDFKDMPINNTQANSDESDEPDETEKEKDEDEKATIAVPDTGKNTDKNESSDSAILYSGAILIVLSGIVAFLAKRHREHKRFES